MDQYSLGIVLYEMLSGHVPFAYRGLGALFRSHRDEPVPQFPANLKIDRQFESIVRKLLAKQPENRFGSVSHVKAELRALGRELPAGIPMGPVETSANRPTARRAGRTTFFQKAIRRLSRIQIAGALVVTVIVIFGFIAASFIFFSDGRDDLNPPTATNDEFPAVIASYSEVKKLLASDGAASDLFGFGGKGAGISGDIVAVAASGDDDLGNSSGAVYLFSRTHDEDGRNYWIEAAKIKPADGAPGHGFGQSLAISGETMVVSSPGHDEFGKTSGAVYIFEKESGAGNWVEVTRLEPNELEAGDEFGGHVDVDSNTIIVSVSGDDDAGVEAGAVYVFERETGNPGSWIQVKKITAGDTTTGDVFGDALAIDGDIIVVGARRNDDRGDESGSAYVFRKDEGGVENWGEVAKLVPDDGAAGDWFGISMAIDGDMAVVGALTADSPAENSGSAYIFQRNSGGPENWGMVKKLTVSDAASEDWYGIVAIDGDVVVVASIYSDSVGADSGSVYVYQRNRNGPDQWGEALKITASDPAPDDQFGSVTIIAGDILLVTSAHHPDNGFNSGAVYVYELECPGQFLAVPIDGIVFCIHLRSFSFTSSVLIRLCCALFSHRSLLTFLVMFLSVSTG